ncbi:hypothetical protein [Candidatus Phyllobacterium onerii]|uniref:hypothetical protein n=1 Tax=Candidatus Phyllobacterium onerii TaxID=3020828 RepID=UPI003A86F042
MFATAGHTSLRGLILFLSPRILFPLQSMGEAAWGLQPLEDQQLAGLVMWIHPASSIPEPPSLVRRCGYRGPQPHMDRAP